MCLKKSHHGGVFFHTGKKAPNGADAQNFKFLQLKFTYLHDNSADRLSSSGEVEIYSGKSHFELVMLKIFVDFDEKNFKMKLLPLPSTRNE